MTLTGKKKNGGTLSPSEENKMSPISSWSKNFFLCQFEIIHEGKILNDFFILNNKNTNTVCFPINTLCFRPKIF
jgi:hypothetical protein